MNWKVLALGSGAVLCWVVLVFLDADPFNFIDTSTDEFWYRVTFVFGLGLVAVTVLVISVVALVVENYRHHHPRTA